MKISYFDQQNKEIGVLFKDEEYEFTNVDITYTITTNYEYIVHIHSYTCTWYNENTDTFDEVTHDQEVISILEKELVDYVDWCIVEEDIYNYYHDDDDER